MKNKLVHPWWVHLPALAALLVFLGFLFSSLPLPANAPVHFRTDWTPDRYGSPWEMAGIIIGLSFLFLSISVVIDELWARQEKRKAFNWLSLLDDVVLGGISGTGISYLIFLQDTQASPVFSAVYFWPVFAGVIVLAVIIEMVRPYRAYHEPLVSTDITQLKTELSLNLRKNGSIVYWDYQHPLYVKLLSTILPLVLIISAFFTWSEVPWAGALLMVTGLLLVIPYGGQRTLVTRDRITVRWGIFGIKVLNLDVSRIDTAEIHNFSPLRDFGGYGIRFNREMQAYYASGNTGVKITTLDGKKYLIGSDRVSELAAVIEGILEAR